MQGSCQTVGPVVLNCRASHLVNTASVPSQQMKLPNLLKVISFASMVMQPQAQSLGLLHASAVRLPCIAAPHARAIDVAIDGVVYHVRDSVLRRRSETIA